MPPGASLFCLRLTLFLFYGSANEPFLISLRSRPHIQRNSRKTEFPRRPVQRFLPRRFHQTRLASMPPASPVAVEPTGPAEQDRWRTLRREVFAPRLAPD